MAKRKRIKPVEVKPSDLRKNCRLGGLKFRSTKEVKPLDRIVGQERALRAIETGLGIESEGYNVYVSGLMGTGRSTTIKAILEKIDSRGKTPPDWCYVHSFRKPDTPRAISLPAGRGKELAGDMDDLVEHLKQDVPKAFEQEQYEKEREKIANKYSEREQKMIEEFRDRARENSFEVTKAPSPYEGLMLLPIVGGKPISEQAELERLAPRKLAQIKENQKNLQVGLMDIVRQGRKLRKQLMGELREHDKKIGLSLVEHHIEELKKKYKSKKLFRYLEEVKEDICKNIDRFRGKKEEQVVFPGLVASRQPDTFLEYRVNVVVDNSETRGVPVVVETAASYSNLFGTIERVVDASGKLVTDFTRIKAGSLLRANGGYLVFDIADALTEIGVWKSLKRTLNNRKGQIQAYDPFSIFSAGGLKPEPIDLDVKIVTVGSSWIYHLLYRLDEDFKKIFKIRADFGSEIDRSARREEQYVRFTAKICRDEGLRHFDRSGVEAVIEYGMRQAGNQKKLSTRFSDIADIIREASYWAGKEKAPLVRRSHVERAGEEKAHRSDRVEKKIQELIEEGKLMVDVRGARVGQVNGLSVYDMGDFVFGKPSRITAQTAMGKAGIINIEREAELSGPLHNKGVFILAGYLRSKYAQDKPLALSASVCFEQSYGGVDGDSASSTELYGLLSSLSRVSIRQSIAVTGSVNQRGQIQPIGGVNEKIEGFYAVCKARGLTGEQGVIIPHQNVKDLMLKKEVVEAVRKKRFHIYPIKTIDRGMEILTGKSAGKISDRETINGKVNERLRELASGLRKFEAEKKVKGRRRKKAGRSPSRG